MRGTIDGVEVFLDDDQSPAISLSATSLVDPSKIKGKTSSTIRVINTPEAARVLGSEFMSVAPSSSRPTLRLGNGSVDTFSANIIPIRHTRSSIECLAEGGNASWFEYAKATKLRNLDLGSSPFITEDYVKGTWTDDGGILYFPLVDYGEFEGRSSAYNVLLSKLRPAVRLGPVVEEALLAYGYTVTPQGTLADWWRKPFCPSTNNRIASGWTWDTAQTGAAARRGGSAAPSYTLVGLSSTPNVYQLTGVEEYDPTNSMSTIAKYTEASTGQARRIVVVEMVFGEALVSAFVGEVMQAVLWDETDGVALATHTTAAIGSTGVLVENVDFGEITIPNGHTVYIGVRSSNSGSLPTFDYELPSTMFVVGSKRGQGYIHPDGEDVDIASCCPDLTVGEAIMSLVNNRCLISVTDDVNMTVDLWYDTEYFLKPSKSIGTRDWRTRIDHTQAPVKVFPEGPRRIDFLFAEDKNDELLTSLSAEAVDEGYGNHTEEIPDAYGKTSSVKMPFAPTAMVETLGTLFIPAMHHKDGTYQQSTFDFAPRILIADGTASGTWTLNSVSQSIYPLCYFANNAASGELLGFDNIDDYGDTRSGTVETYWRDRLDRENSGRFLEAYFFIRDHELQDFNHGLPTLVDDGSGPAWYYVLEIMQHRVGKGEPTKCLLVEVPSAVTSSTALINPVIQYPDANNPVHFRFTSDLNASLTLGVYTNTGYFTVREPSGFMATYPSGSISDGHNPGGVATQYEVWASDAAGNTTGGVTSISISTQQVTAFSPVSLPVLTSLVLIENTITILSTETMASLTSIDCSYCYDLEDIDLSGAPLVEVIQFQSCGVTAADTSNNPLLNFIGFSGCALADVDGIINNADPTLTGTAQLSGGSNAAPTGASAAALNALTVAADLTVSGAGSSAANGSDYVLSTPLNGRDRYTHTGAFIFWNGTKWRIQTGGGDIYEGTEDVMQPWMVTTWTAIGGTPTPVPTLTAPSLGLWSVSTN